MPRLPFHTPFHTRRVSLNPTSRQAQAGDDPSDPRLSYLALPWPSPTILLGGCRASPALSCQSLPPPLRHRPILGLAQRRGGVDRRSCHGERFLAPGSAPRFLAHPHGDAAYHSCHAGRPRGSEAHRRYGRAHRAPGSAQRSLVCHRGSAACYSSSKGRQTCRGPACASPRNVTRDPAAARSRAAERGWQGGGGEAAASNAHGPQSDVPDKRSLGLGCNGAGDTPGLGDAIGVRDQVAQDGRDLICHLITMRNHDCSRARELVVVSCPSPYAARKDAWREQERR